VFRVDRPKRKRVTYSGTTKAIEVIMDLQKLRDDLPEGLDLADAYSWANDNDHPSPEDIEEMDRLTDFDSFDDDDDDY
jgi:hypothetical protein